jgi:hypothetical protein
MTDQANIHDLTAAEQALLKAVRSGQPGAITAALYEALPSEFQAFTPEPPAYEPPPAKHEPAVVTSTRHPAGQTYTPQQVVNFRRAFLVVGTLIANGRIDIDFESQWHYGFEVMVYDVAAALNLTED